MVLLHSQMAKHFSANTDGPKNDVQGVINQEEAKIG